MLLLAVLWGLSIPATKLGLQTVPPLTLTAMRFAVAVPVLLVLILGKGRVPSDAVLRLAGLGLLGVSVGQVAQALGVERTSAAVGTIISAIIPVLVVVFAALRLKQPITGRQKLGLLVAFAGVALVAVGNEGEPVHALEAGLMGAVWLLLSAVCIAFYYVWSVELAEEVGTVQVAAWSTVFGFVATLPFVAWEIRQTPMRMTAEVVGVALYLGVVVTVVGLFLWLYLLRTVPARVAAGVQYLQPVVGIAAASAVFGEPLGPLFFLGVVFVLGGLAGVVTPGARPEQAARREGAGGMGVGEVAEGDR